MPDSPSAYLAVIIESKEKKKKSVQLIILELRLGKREQKHRREEVGSEEEAKGAII